MNAPPSRTDAEVLSRISPRVIYTRPSKDADMSFLRSSSRVTPPPTLLARVLVSVTLPVMALCVVGATAPGVADEDDSGTDQLEPEVGYDWEMERRHWAYRPIAHPVVPDVADEAWCRNDIDRFILASLEESGLEPAPEASRETLVRRLYFDLLGLPPTAEQVRDFIEDDADDVLAAIDRRATTTATSSRCSTTSA